MMNPHAGAVDHPRITLVSCYDRVHYRVAHISLGQPAEPVVAGRMVPVAIRNVRPWRAVAQNPEDAIENQTIIDTRHTTRLLREN